MNKSQFVSTFAASLTCLPDLLIERNTQLLPRLTWRARER